MIPQLAQLLSPEEVQRVHEASLEILDQVGLEVNNPRARERFREHGCRVDDTTERVTFPSAVIEECLKSIPPKFTFYAQDPEFDRVIPDQAPLVITASSAPYIIDPVTGKERFSTSEDIARVARLIDGLPAIDLFSVSVLASDAPAGQYSLSRFYTALKHCRKPIRGSGDTGIDCESILQLAYAIAGS
jgi:trimethylamine--corrinoid protein Co-methyltransferase